MRAAPDFVGIYRWALDDLAHRLDEATFGFFVRLLAEASYKTGYVRGSIRSFADTFGLNRRTVNRYLRVLSEEGEVRVDAGRNQHERGGLAILRYSEYVHAPGARKRAGAGGGAGAGAEPAPAESRDLQEQPTSTAEKTQDSVRSSALSARSLSIARRPASREMENPESEDWRAKREQQRPRMREEIAREKAAKKKRMAEDFAGVVEAMREGA
jgi:hypothetical protein